MKKSENVLVIILVLLIIMVSLTLLNTKNIRSAEVNQIASSDSCKTCHFNLSLKWTKNSHYNISKESSSGKGECQVCHGLNDEELKNENADDKHKMLIPNSFEEANKVCGQCHFNNSNSKVKGFKINQQFWKKSNHGKSNLACTQCHKMHQKELKLQSNKFCLNCHGPGNAIAFSQDIKSHKSDQQCLVCHNPHKKSLTINRFDQKYKHYPVAQNKCFDCHSTHMASSDKLTKKSDNKICYQCHKAKSLVFPNASHAEAKGVAGKGLCINCHNPHSSNVKDLLRQPANKICRSCHYKYQAHHFLGIKIDKKIGCITCHRPHGGGNKALLKVSSKKLCKQCHIQF